MNFNLLKIIAHPQQHDKLYWIVISSEIKKEGYGVWIGRVVYTHFHDNVSIVQWKQFHFYI